MRKNNFRILLSVFAVAAVLMTSCSKKMDPLTSNLFNAEPSPLELIGTKVPVTINGRFPAKWFHKNATVVVTPVLKYAEGEAVGVSQSFQGEKVSGNAMVINQENGAPITLRSSFNYVDAMNTSDLCLRIEVYKNGKLDVAFPDLKIADGVLATAALADAKTSTPAIAPDAFQRIIKETHDANIMFLIQRAELRANEINSQSVSVWKDIVKEANDNNRKNLNVEISAYASPDGGLTLNEKLAAQREKNTSSFLSTEFKKEDIDSNINAHYTAQDWEGFKQLVQASALQDKKLVLSVLSMYSDPVAREKEIKNISAVYSELAETILPQLRRSRLIANVEIIGKTDAELVVAIKQASSELALEEVLYAATLKGVDAQAAYTVATKRFPNDYRGWNNLGVCLYEAGDFNKATQMFNKAKQVSSVKAVEANMNLALVEILNGDFSKAEQLLGNASGANTINETMGLLYIKQGNYAKAEQAFGEVKTNNAAVSQILNKNYNKAQKTLDSVAKKDGITSYLKAVVAARTNNSAGVTSNLKDAIANGVTKAQVANDAEFARFKSQLGNL